MRVGTAAVAMVLVAEAAVWLLRPRERPIEPAPVSESDYFTPAQIERGRAYGDGQLWLLLGAVGAQGAVLVTLALGRPAIVRRGLQRLEARPVIGAAAAGAGLSVALGAAALPAENRRARARRRLRDLHPVARLLARRRRQVGGDRGGAGRRGRSASDRPGAPLREALVAAREPRCGRDRRRLRLARTGRAGPAVQQVLAAAGRQQGSLRGAGARKSGRGGHRAGVPSRRQPPGAVPERLRRRDRVDQARGPLRHPAGAHESPRAAVDRRPRARPRQARRHPARARVRGARGAAGAAVRARAGRGRRTARRGRRVAAPPRCPPTPSAWPWPRSCSGWWETSSRAGWRRARTPSPWSSPTTQGP